MKATIAMTTDPQDRRITQINNWFSLAKSAVWVIGLVAILAMKLNSIDNVNANQDTQIAKTQEDVKVLKNSIDTIKDKQVDQLVMLTKLVTLAEQGQLVATTGQQSKQNGSKRP